VWSKPRMSRRVRSGILAAAFACHAACGGDTPSSPSETVAGRWHGTTVVQTSGSPLNYNREDITLHPDGTADVQEYEGPLRGDVGAWSLVGTQITIDFRTFCDRRGTVAGRTMSLECSRGGRTWELGYEKQ
jgi:hypothetical protein